MVDSSETGEWREVNSIAKSKKNDTNSNQQSNDQTPPQKTLKNRSQEESKNKPSEIKSQQKKMISDCRRSKMSGGTRLIEILIVILILQRITAGTDLFC